jgi:hypothetical protein
VAKWKRRRLFAMIYNRNLDRAIPLLVQEMNANNA